LASLNRFVIGRNRGPPILAKSEEWVEYHNYKHQSKGILIDLCLYVRRCGRRASCGPYRARNLPGVEYPTWACEGLRHAARAGGQQKDESHGGVGSVTPTSRGDPEKVHRCRDQRSAMLWQTHATAIGQTRLLSVRLSRSPHERIRLCR